jgi:hypothetical protein
MEICKFPANTKHKSERNCYYQVKWDQIDILLLIVDESNMKLSNPLTKNKWK